MDWASCTACCDSTGNHHIVAIAVEEDGVFASAVTFGMKFGIGLTFRRSR